MAAREEHRDGRVTRTTKAVMRKRRNRATRERLREEREEMGGREVERGMEDAAVGWTKEMRDVPNMHEESRSERRPRSSISLTNDAITAPTSFRRLNSL